MTFGSTDLKKVCLLFRFRAGAELAPAPRGSLAGVSTPAYVSHRAYVPSSEGSKPDMMVSFADPREVTDRATPCYDAP